MSLFFFQFELKSELLLLKIIIINYINGICSVDIYYSIHIFTFILSFEFIIEKKKKKWIGQGWDFFFFFL
jgi:hypothetical protein